MDNSAKISKANKARIRARVSSFELRPNFKYISTIMELRQLEYMFRAFLYMFQCEKLKILICPLVLEYNRGNKI